MPADTVRVGVRGGVTATAVGPLTPADTFAFAQVYETLVNVACDGSLVSALAERWEGDTTGRVWTLFIRHGAAFHDGSPVQAIGVAAAWRARRAVPGVDSDPRLLAVEAVTIESERAISVRFRDPHRSGPRPLADPYYAVHRRSGESSALFGSSRYEWPGIRDISSGRASTDSLLSPHDLRSGAPVLALHTAPSSDYRDLIDMDVDVLVTADRRAIEYAATRPGWRVRQLPRDRAYVLLSTARYPGGRHPIRRPASTPAFGAATPFVRPDDARWDPLRRAIGRDVLRIAGDQTATRWWISEAMEMGCIIDWSPPPDEPPHPHAPAQSRNRPRLAYAATDPVAEAIATRLVALGMDSTSRSEDARAARELLPELVAEGSEPVRAVALPGPELAGALLSRSELAYLIAVPRHALDPCAAWHAFSARAPWVAPTRVAFIAESGPSVVTSPRAPALWADWNNTLRIIGRTAPPGAGR